MKNDSVIVSVSEGVMSLILNRPESLNAYNDDIYKGLMGAFEQAKYDKDIKVILLSGSGRSFCSGGDVKGMGKSSSSIMGVQDTLVRVNNLVLTMAELGQPIIAMVHGYAAGIGVSIALACDQVIVADDCKFILSYSRVGLIADGGGHFFLTRAVGPYRAKELMYKAEPISAGKAYEYGMVNQVVPADELLERAQEYAVTLSKGPSRSFSMIKKLVNKALVTDLKTILDMEHTAMPIMTLTSDHMEGVASFKEKRKPIFTGE